MYAQLRLMAIANIVLMLICLGLTVFHILLQKERQEAIFLLDNTMQFKMTFRDGTNHEWVDVSAGTILRYSNGQSSPLDSLKLK